VTTVTLRFFAAARASAGTGEKTLTGDALTIRACLELARSGAADYDEVMTRCSFLVDSIATTDRELPLADGAVVDILPPFAGG
jgi:molybdopterin synthase sulfur carrier subunit